MPTMSRERICVAIAPLEGPTYQIHVGMLGIVKTIRPFMGWNFHGITDDFGNLQSINFYALAVSLS